METDTKLSRIDRVREAHPCVSDGAVRAILILAYNRLITDPTVAGNDDNLQIQLECLTDYLIRATDEQIKDEVAKAQEFFPDGFDDFDAHVQGQEDN